MVTKEDNKYDNRHGLLINKGWLPHENKEPHNRFNKEDSFN